MQHAKKRSKAVGYVGFDLLTYECLSWVLEGKGFDQYIINIGENAYQNIITDWEWWEECPQVLHLKTGFKHGDPVSLFFHLVIDLPFLTRKW